MFFFGSRLWQGGAYPRSALLPKCDLGMVQGQGISTTQEPPSKESTYRRHDELRVRRFVGYLRNAGVSKASDISAQHVQDYQNERLETASPTAIRHDLLAVSGLLSFAVECSYPLDNVARQVRKVKSCRNPPPTLSYEEPPRVLDVAQRTSTLAPSRTIHSRTARGWMRTSCSRLPARHKLMMCRWTPNAAGNSIRIPWSSLRSLSSRNGRLGRLCY